MANEDAQATSAAAARARALMFIFPGILLTGGLATVASTLAVVSPVPGVFIALILGLCFSSIANRSVFAAGIDFCAKTILRLGVVLLGARITFADMAELGANAVCITIGALVLTLCLGALLTRALKLDTAQGIILAGATAICGASAALAIAAVLPQSKRTEADLAATVAGVTLVGTACMIVYPLIANALGFDPRATGLFLGASLHEVAQAVGAGYAVSPEAGAAATTTKLLRVACLAPVVLTLSWIFAGKCVKGVAAPRFLIAFAILAACGSLKVLPHAFIATASLTSQWLLLTAIAALGLRTSPRELRAVGARPFVVIIALSAALSAMVMLVLFLLR